MPYLIDRKSDVFISYAHRDDDPSRWVRSFANNFQKDLERQLRIKENTQGPIDLEVFKGHKLPQHGELARRIDDAVKQSALLVVVMSKSYLLSDWCKREGEIFVENLGLESKSNIFIIEKEPTEQEWPAFLKDDAGGPLLSYKFYEEVDLDKPQTIPMITRQGGADPMGMVRVSELVDDVSKELYLKKHFPETKPTQKERVFLAVSPEGVAMRNRSRFITEILRLRPDVEIIPSSHPRTPEEFESLLSGSLSRSDLFVQVLDRSCGVSLSEDPAGFVRHQYMSAVTAKLPVLQWFAETMDFASMEDSPYKEFLSARSTLVNAEDPIRNGHEETAPESLPQEVADLGERPLEQTSQNGSASEEVLSGEAVESTSSTEEATQGEPGPQENSPESDAGNATTSEDATLVEGTLEDLARAVDAWLRRRTRSSRPVHTLSEPCFVAVKSGRTDIDCARGIGKSLSRIDNLLIPILPHRKISARDFDTLQDRTKGLIIVWGEIEQEWIFDEIRRFVQEMAPTGKQGALAVFDPMPKPFALTESPQMLVVDMSNEAESAKSVEGLERFVARLAPPPQVAHE